MAAITKLPQIEFHCTPSVGNCHTVHITSIALQVLPYCKHTRTHTHIRRLILLSFFFLLFLSLVVVVVETSSTTHSQIYQDNNCINTLWLQYILTLLYVLILFFFNIYKLNISHFSVSFHQHLHYLFVQPTVCLCVFLSNFFFAIIIHVP